MSLVVAWLTHNCEIVKRVLCLHTKEAKRGRRDVPFKGVLCEWQEPFGAGEIPEKGTKKKANKRDARDPVIASLTD